MRELLEASDVALENLRDFVVFDSTHYRRNLVSIGPRYEILVIGWQSGQRGPIHNHAASTYDPKVLEGVCTETIFGQSPRGQVVVLSRHHAGAGYVCASQDADTHHSMKKISITGPSAEEWRPPVSEFSQSAGIQTHATNFCMISPHSFNPAPAHSIRSRAGS